MDRKPVVAMDLSTTGKGGGPYVNTVRLMGSGLRDMIDFQVLWYRTELGGNICVRRILDLRNQIRDLKPDVVHFTGLQLSGFHVAVACKLAGVKRTVVTIHGFSKDALYFHPIKRLLLAFVIEPLTLLLCSRIYGVSNFVMSSRILYPFSRKCCGAIYNFPPDPYLPDGTPDIREELGLSDLDVVVVSVGRVIRDKGYAILDEAILQCNDVANLKFLIVGDGDYLSTMKQKLKQQANNGQVCFLGYRSDIQRILNGSDIFVLPTLHETLSIALLEASIQGLALIASNTGGVPEIIEHGANGLLTPPGDVEALVDAINILYGSKSLRDQYGHAALLRVKERFNKEAIERQIRDVYRSLNLDVAEV